MADKTVENLQTLKIHRLTQEQYERALAAGEISESELYFTPAVAHPGGGGGSVPQEVLDHITDKENPHQVTAEQVGALSAAEDFNAFELWTPGSFSKGTGNVSSGTFNTSLITKDFVSPAVGKVYADKNYCFSVYAYDKSGTYVGVWSGNSFVVSASATEAFVDSFTLSNYEDYKFKLKAKNTANNTFDKLGGGDAVAGQKKICAAIHFGNRAYYTGGVKSVNGIKPDESGNVEIAGGGVPSDALVDKSNTLHYQEGKVWEKRIDGTCYFEAWLEFYLESGTAQAGELVFAPDPFYLDFDLYNPEIVVTIDGYDTEHMQEYLEFLDIVTYHDPEGELNAVMVEVYALEGLADKMLENGEDSVFGGLTVYINARWWEE